MRRRCGPPDDKETINQCRIEAPGQAGKIKGVGLCKSSAGKLLIERPRARQAESMVLEKTRNRRRFGPIGRVENREVAELSVFLMACATIRAFFRLSFCSGYFTECRGFSLMIMKAFFYCSPKEDLQIAFKVLRSKMFLSCSAIASLNSFRCSKLFFTTTV